MSKVSQQINAIFAFFFVSTASGLSKPPRNPPPKWPRRSTPGYSPSSEATSVFHPPSTVSQSSLNFNFGRVSAKQRLGSRSGAQPLATVTILPEGENGSASGPLKMLTSFTMVADLEEERAKSRQQLRSDNIFNQPGWVIIFLPSPLSLE